MKYKTLLQTFFARFLNLVFSFGLIIYSTNIWGSTGKGIISIFTADLAIIIFFCNIFSGSTVSFFSSKLKTEQILLYAYLWSFFTGLLVPVILSFVHVQQFTGYLVVLSVLLSLLTTNVNLFVGRQNIAMYNLYTILQLALHLVMIFGVIYLFGITDVQSYFLAQLLSHGLLFAVSSFQIWRKCRFSEVSFSADVAKNLFRYGWKSQFSAFLHFLNNRLSFYFLEFFKGIATVGVFSIGVAFSEAIWTVSKSLAIMLYSDIVNSNKPEDDIAKTKISMKISFMVTLIFILVMLVIPSKFYTIVFGKGFHETREIILLMSPGILAMAVSNILGFYFAGINKLGILNVKAIAGLAFTVVSSLYFIPRWGIVGGCIVTSFSYCLSSAILFFYFYQNTAFRWQDFVFDKSELRSLLSKIKTQK